MTVRGSVKDRKSGEPVEGAAITVSIAGVEIASLLTDKDGKYEHIGQTDYSGKTVVLSVRKIGYRTQQAVHEGIAEADITLDVEMVPIADGIPWKLIAVGGGGVVVVAVLVLIGLWLFRPPVATPSIAPSGLQGEVKLITLSSETKGAAIRYTVDGSDPAKGAKYGDPFEVTANATVNAVASKFLRRGSQVATMEIIFTVAAPSVDPPTRAYAGNQLVVTMGPRTSGASIEYVQTSPGGAVDWGAKKQYSNPITITESQTITARSTKPGWTTSGETTRTYTLTPSQPAITEDCIPFRPASLELRQEGTSWLLTDGRSRMILFPNRQEADTALQIIRHYGFDNQCFVGRPGPSMAYFLSSGRPPVGAAPGEDCVSFNPNNLAVGQSGSLWRLVDGSHLLMSFPNREEAETALGIIQKYGFTRSCFVGRPDPSMTYLRK